MHHARHAGYPPSLSSGMTADYHAGCLHHAFYTLQDSLTQPACPAGSVHHMVQASCTTAMRLALYRLLEGMWKSAPGTSCMQSSPRPCRQPTPDQAPPGRKPFVTQQPTHHTIPCALGHLLLDVWGRRVHVGAPLLAQLPAAAATRSSRHAHAAQLSTTHQVSTQPCGSSGSRSGTVSDGARGSSSRREC